jgi:hypothetical protein
MKWIVDLLRQQSISGDGAMNVRSFQRNDRVGEAEVFENLNVTHGRLDHRFGRRRAILFSRSFSSEPPLTPMRIGTFCACAARTTSTMRSCLPMLPGLSRSLSMPASSASSASL